MSDSQLQDDDGSPSLVTKTKERRFGRYQLCFELASGGMASVFLARVKGPGGFEKLVALKRIHPHLAKERRFVEMFLDEARIASRIDHPNVCSVFDFGAAEDTYFIAMEYIVGETLRDVARRLESHSIPPRPGYAARALVDACEGLHAAHELVDPAGDPLRVVHRDVSPHNLFLGYDGTVRVVDFGIASARGRLHDTVSGVVKGKYAYMAPEQLRGRAVDRRADIWSLGVVLWELTTLHRLFRRDTESETIFSVTEDEVLPPSVVRPELPPELDAIVLKALARDPARRYATAREMGRDLMRLIARGDPVGRADLSDWMGSIFPGGQGRKMRLVEIATQAADGLQPADPPEDRTERDEVSGDSHSHLRPKAASGLDRPEARPAASGVRWALVGAIFTLVLVGALAGIIAALTTAASGPAPVPAPVSPAPVAPVQVAPER